MNETISLCPHADICGGCSYQGIDYQKQLDIKNDLVLKFLLEKKLRCGEYSPTCPAPAITAYRNKMEYSFGDDEKGGPMTLGLHRKGSYMSVINTDCCKIVPADFNLICKATLKHMREHNHSFHKKRSHHGFLRHLVLRYGESGGELLVNLVTTNEEKLAENEFSKMLLALPLDNKIVGILHTINNKRSDTVDCESYNMLFGRDHYFEELMGMKFKVGAFTFFQTNTQAAKRLFTEALSLIPDKKDSRIFDIYCGTGTVSLALSQKAKAVVGIEINPDSVAAARENAIINNINNCLFIEGDAFDGLTSLGEKPDMLIVDPPRMGIHPKALTKIASYDLDQILYISCNPKTFCENALSLSYAGYRIETLKVYDNFPQTKHIELVALLKKHT